MADRETAAIALVPMCVGPALAGPGGQPSRNRIPFLLSIGATVLGPSEMWSPYIPHGELSKQATSIRCFIFARIDLAQFLQRRVAAHTWADVPQIYTFPTQRTRRTLGNAPESLRCLFLYLHSVHGQRRAGARVSHDAALLLRLVKKRAASLYPLSRL